MDLRLSFVQNTTQGLFNDLLEDTIDCAFATLRARCLELVSHKLGTFEAGAAALCRKPGDEQKPGGASPIC
jgi:hypothetical protein